METIKLLIICFQVAREILRVINANHQKGAERLEKVANFKDELRKVRTGNAKDTSALESNFRSVFIPDGMPDKGK